jgi:Type I phosphodiesterase / nucleotide pyrophosphatase
MAGFGAGDALTSSPVTAAPALPQHDAGRPAPVLPRYGGPCLDGLSPGLLAAPGHRPGWLPAPAADARQVVLLVIDGLGWEQLTARRRLAPALHDMIGGPITSVAPSTTATALATIALGRSPAAHGVVGYRVRVAGPSGDEVLNVLRWRTHSGDARQFLPPTEFQPEPAFGGKGVPALTRVEFADTGFTAAHLRGSRMVWWGAASALAVDIRRLLAAGEPFVYAYYDGIDKIAHLHGLDDHYDAELAAVDRLAGDVASVLPPGAALVITADHGQVDVGHALVDLHPEILEQTALVSGEARFCWLHAKPGRAGALLEVAKAHCEGQAWVATLDELERDDWFGGTLSDRVRSRLGDVAVVAHEPVGFVDPHDRGEVRLVCRHGSLTAAEMLVPLLAVQG